MSDTINELQKKGFKVKVKHFRHKIQDFTKLNKVAEKLASQNSHDLDILNELTNFEPIHTKQFRSMATLGADMAPRGGKTEVVLIKDGVSAFGNSYCSLNDNFVYRIGREMALGRAVKAYEKIISENAKPAVLA